MVIVYYVEDQVAVYYVEDQIADGWLTNILMEVPHRIW